MHKEKELFFEAQSTYYSFTSGSKAKTLAKNEISLCLISAHMYLWDFQGKRQKQGSDVSWF